MSKKKLKAKINNPDFAEGTTEGWDARFNTGWKIEGKQWVQYKKGVKTGATRGIKDQGDFYHDESTGRDMRWSPPHSKYMPSYGSSPAQFITRPIRNRLKAIKKGYQENPGILGIADPRVWSAMNQIRKANKQALQFEETYKTIDNLKTVNQKKPNKSDLWISPKGFEYNLEETHKNYSKYKYVKDPKNKANLLMVLRDEHKPKPVPKKGFFEKGGWLRDKEGDINPGGPGNRLGDSFDDPMEGN
tara:strand:- start:36 stop:770 length:735 start_codon:yes stop_codon:yes gene_type:complete